MDARSEPSFSEGQISTTHEKRLELLLQTGLRLASERNLERIVETVLAAGVQLTQAPFGALVYCVVPEGGERRVVRKTLGLADDFSSYGVPEPGELIGSKNLTHFAGIPPSGFSFRNYDSISINSGTGELLGALLLADPVDGLTTGQMAQALQTLAMQTAAAMESSRLTCDLQRNIVLADRERADAARRLRQALDAAQLGTWSWDRQTDLLELDERAGEIFGAKPQERVTRTSLRERIVFSDDLPLTPENLNDLLETGKAYRSEYRVDTEGGQRWVSSRGLPSLAEDEKTITGMAGTVQDITAQRTQEATLRQTEKLAATGRMAATIAHEINNPLEAVTNLIYLSKTDPSVPRDVQHLLELADTELARVSQIAQQTLGFYRDTSQPVDIDLSGLLHGVADLFSRKLQSRNLRIDLDVHDNLFIRGLQGEVRQVFSNLMVNAIDASTKGIIRVRARPRSLLGVGGVAVMICDEGAGIPHEIRPKLFAPFFTTKQSIGTGLGLWVTRGIVEKSGGRVGFRSRVDPPTGTIFRVFLPSASSEKDSSGRLETTILQ